MNAEYTVALIVDPAFGARLSEIAGRMPVWIVDTPVNRLAAEQHWAQHPAQSYTEGVTTFTGNPAGTPEEWCVGELHTIDVHHGELSHVPPYKAIEVHGVVFNARLAAAFAEYAMREITATSDGFRAERSRSAA
jgi:hypothetical protein